MLVPHQRSIPRCTDIATGNARTTPDLVPVGPQACNGKCDGEGGDDEEQQTENMF
jgi:hypothetical protein